MAKSTLQNLDSGQLDLMWSMLQLGGIKADDHDVDKLIEYADKIRQALIQKTAGQRSNDPNGYVSFDDLGTYINLLVLEVLTLRVGGRLEMMYKEDSDG
jgi:hypothetical protein